jgi:hypothetical protein
MEREISVQELQYFNRCSLTWTAVIDNLKPIFISMYFNINPQRTMGTPLVVAKCMQEGRKDNHAHAHTLNWTLFLSHKYHFRCVHKIAKSDN